MTVALKLQDSVDNMFENARTGETSLFGYVADEDDRYVALLGDIYELLGAAADLTHAAGEGTECRVVDRLDRVDHNELRSGFFDRVDDVWQRCLCVQPKLSLCCPQSLSAQLNLLSAFFSGDVERWPARRGEYLQEQRALANSRFATKESDRTRDESPSEYPIEFGYRSADRPPYIGSDIGDQLWSWAVGRSGWLGVGTR